MRVCRDTGKEDKAEEDWSGKLCLRSEVYERDLALTVVNQLLTKLQQAVEEQIRIVLIPTSSQDMDHLHKSIKNYNLNIKVVCGKSLHEHLDEIKPVLFLSTNAQNVREAITAGFGAAVMFQRDNLEHSNDVLCVAFDGDGVLFSDESEKVYKEKDLKAFNQNETENEDKPLKPVRLLSETTC
ncbi:hypothetical protein Q8A67_011351 [Cirrhinus molitorella]|uniref:Uncharacterized protein n=1 Tax=Cirrhinus molitorella TaxID=172907 RepID=A0AA88PUR7_9TELE|nr:hypothetical protein Q8A67_011351 [Cirrhinus molitorella]